MAETPTESIVVRCRCCNYDLAGLPRDGLCPECGDLVAASVGWHDNARAPAVCAVAVAVCGLVALPCVYVWSLAFFGGGMVLSLDAVTRCTPGPRNRLTRNLAVTALAVNLLLLTAVTIFFITVTER